MAALEACSGAAGGGAVDELLRQRDRTRHFGHGRGNAVAGIDALPGLLVLDGPR